MRTRSRITSQDWGLLLLRFGIALLMILGHAFTKAMDYEYLITRFPDPFGIGSEPMLVLTLIIEITASLLILFGLGTRIGALALLVTMLTAALIVHRPEPWAAKELAVVYALVYFTLLVAGGGRLSMDSRIALLLEPGSWAHRIFGR